LESKAMTDQIASEASAATHQDGESTQPDVTEALTQSTSEHGESPEAPAKGEQEEGKDPNAWALKRIGALTAKSHEAERNAQAARGEAERYRLLVEQMQRGDTPATVTDPAQPANIDELVSKRATELAQQQQMAERGQSVSKVGAEAYPDFMSAVTTLDALGISGEQVHSLLGMEDAHKVIYTLGKNPEEALRILALPPLQQGRELERMALKAGQPAPKAVSNAPAPIKSIDGSTTVETDPSKMSMGDWVKWREKTTKTRF
jgi:hypothetical protein